MLMVSACAVKEQVRPKQILPEKKEATGEGYAHVLLAHMAYMKGDIDTAKQHVYQALVKDPNSAYLNLFMSNLLRESGEWEEALIYAKRAISANQNYPGAYAQAGDLYMQKKDEQKATEYYQEAFRLDPGNERVASILLGLLMKNERSEEALSVLDRLIEKRPDLTVAHYYKAKVLIELDRLEEAENILVNLLNADSGIPGVYMDLLNIYEYKGRFKDAKELLFNMIQQNPKDLRLRERYIDLCLKLNDTKAIEEQLEALSKEATSEGIKKFLSSIYIRMRRYHDAINILKDLLEKDPSDQRLRLLLAISYEGAGDVKKALDNFLSIPKESEYYSSAIYEASMLLIENKNYEKAIALLTENEETLRKEGRYYIIYSLIFEKKNNLEGAIKILKDGLKALGPNEELLYRLGILYDKSREKEKAIHTMQKILEKNENHADALNYIGYTYADEGRNLKEALKLIKKALRLKPGSGYIIDSLGWVYFRMGDLEKAKRYLLQALELEPNDPTIREHLGELYERLGLKDAAIKHYKRSLDLGNPNRNKILKAIERLKGK